jgi:murein tripeptide amidase MpaA
VFGPIVPRMTVSIDDVRRRYVRYAEQQQLLQQLVQRHPDLVRLQRIGSSAQGRPLYVVIVGRDPDRARPALWIDANMHAGEFVGTNVALAFVDDLLALHAGDNRHGLSEAVAAAAKEALIIVAPSLSPDGAEAVHETGRFVRSSPVDDRKTAEPRWRQVDIDGDGQIRRMRVLDPCGGFVESKDVPGLMLPRDVDDDGPFYALYPEGVIDDWDGDSVPPWGIYDDNPLDLNRNFSHGWQHEPLQYGAGDYAGSSPEARALMAFATTNPHLYFWINLHTYGGVWIRPLGDKSDDKLSGADFALFRLVEEWATTHAHVPTVSGYHEFLYTPETPLRGDLVDYAFLQRGAYAWAIELWDLYARAGLPRPRRFVDHYAHQSRGQMELLARTVSQLGASPIRPWRWTKHPQLGDVEVGGLDARTSVWNPPEGPLVDEVCRGHAAVFFRLLSLLPRLHVTTSRAPLGDGTSLVTVTVENRGGVSTAGPDVARGLPHNEPVHVVVQDAGRVKDGARRTLGHLGGTHAGRFGGIGTWPYQSSQALPARRTCRFVVVGDDPVMLRVGSQRTGHLMVTA